MKKRLLRLILLSGSIIIGYGQSISFTRIDTGAIVRDLGGHCGSSWADFDNDGDLDLMVGNTNDYISNRPNLFYKNERDVGFVKITSGTLGHQVFNVNISEAWGDFDNDGDWDLSTPCTLFRNDGFGDFTSAYSFHGESYSNCFENPCWVDINNDGNLDLFSWAFGLNNLFLGNGDGSFSQEIDDTLVTILSNYRGVAWSDYDNDYDLDAFIISLESNIYDSTSYGINYLMINNGNYFSLLKKPNVVLQDTVGAIGASWGDYNNDGRMDLFINTTACSKLYKNNGNDSFVKIDALPNEYSNKIFSGLSWGDFNNDGNLDLFLTSETNDYLNLDFNKQNILLVNNGEDTFSELEDTTIKKDGGSTCSIADYDNDGDLDIFIVNGLLGTPNYKNYLYINNGNSNHWIEISLIGNPSNKSAIGARVKLKAIINGLPVWQTRELTQPNGTYSCNSSRFHFGLGDAEKIDTIMIYWPSGNIDSINNIESNWFYKAIEKESFNIDFQVYNYIKLLPLQDQRINNPEDSILVDLNDYFTFIKSDTFPEFEIDTITYSILHNTHPEIANTSVTGSILKIKGGLEQGTSEIKIIAVNSFASNFDEIAVAVNYPIMNVAISDVKNELQIFPNPASDIIKFKIDKKDKLYQIRIFNLGGQVVNYQSISLINNEIDISNLKPGIYFVFVTSSYSNYYEKLIKE